ncbi:AMP-binding protein [Hymenobacter algoricola]|uniref:AMP-dependent synthetase/ligase domain-containing protein n=1 Tax=Hymenobacter algoricola TaxID=486267 RepID=A0ABP7MZT8_9BACT
MHPNFFATIHATLSAHPDRVLVVWPAACAGQAPATYTGGALLLRIEAGRAALRAQGVRPGQPVLLARPVSFELICLLLAVMSLGAVPVLPPAGASALGLWRVARRSKIRQALVAPALPWPARLLARALGLRLSADSGALPAPAPAWTAQRVAAGQPALISHSSGSTGPAKPIRRSHRVLQAQHEALRQAFPPLPGQRDFPLFPNVLLHNLAAGVCTLLPDVAWGAPARLEPARIVRQLRQQGVQTLTGNVFYFARLADYLTAVPTALPAVVALGVGGSPVPEGLMRRLAQLFAQARCYVIYGSSEAEPIAVRQLTDAAGLPEAGYCVGPILPALSWRLHPLGAVWVGAGRPLAQVGELQVKGAHVATAAPDGWLSTGDFGYLDADGRLCLTGRQGNEAIRQQQQHYQLEHVLQHLPGVARVAARPGRRGFVVYVEPAAGAVVAEAAVRAALAVFPGPVCEQVHFRRRLPVDSRHLSKIRYGAVR